MAVSPFQTNIFFDSCLDSTCNGENEFASMLFENKELPIVIAHSTAKEIHHTNTPKETKDMIKSRICTMNTNLTDKDYEDYEKILGIFTGNGKKKNMEKDAENFFNAFKHGSYFITTDQRILKKRNEIYKTLGLSCKIMLPSELYSLVGCFKEQDKLEEQVWILHEERDKYQINSLEYKTLDKFSFELEQKWGGVMMECSIF